MLKEKNEKETDALEENRQFKSVINPNSINPSGPHNHLYGDGQKNFGVGSGDPPSLPHSLQGGNPSTLSGSIRAQLQPLGRERGTSYAK